MENKHMKKLPTSFVITELQTKNEILPREKKTNNEAPVHTY